MTNREWLLNKMQNMSDEELRDFDVGQLICDMLEVDTCKEVHSDCRLCKMNWLKSEHKEKITLSEAERIILENIDKDYKWIARDGNQNLNVYVEKPYKYFDNEDYWCVGGSKEEKQFFSIVLFNHLFQFITWEDEQAYNVEELLKQ